MCSGHLSMDQKHYLVILSLPFQDDKRVHSPRQVEESLVRSDCIHSPVSYDLWFERREELGKPTKYKNIF